MLDVEIVAPDPVYPILRNNKRAYVWETRAYLAYAGNRRLLRVSPVGVTGYEGDFYVLETAYEEDVVHTGPRIRRLSPDGTSSVLVTLGESG